MTEHEYDKIANSVTDGSIVSVVFDNEQSLIGYLRKLKDEDLGISVVVSGLFDVVGECCSKADLKLNSVNMSLGIYGNLSKLADEKHREITTMCGHGMITSQMVIKAVEKIKKGRSTGEKEANEMSRMCICGVMNPTRAAILLEKMTQVE